MEMSSPNPTALFMRTLSCAQRPKQTHDIADNADPKVEFLSNWINCCSTRLGGVVIRSAIIVVLTVLSFGSFGHLLVVCIDTQNPTEDRYVRGGDKG